MTDAPRISDAEVGAFKDAADAEGLKDYRVRQALAAFLAARVPPYTDGYEGGSPYDRGFNACRGIVLSGRAEGTK